MEECLIYVHININMNLKISDATKYLKIILKSVNEYQLLSNDFNIPCFHNSVGLLNFLDYMCTLNV